MEDEPKSAWETGREDSQELDEQLDNPESLHKLKSRESINLEEGQIAAEALGLLKEKAPELDLDTKKGEDLTEVQIERVHEVQDTIDEPENVSSLGSLISELPERQPQLRQVLSSTQSTAPGTADKSSQQEDIQASSSGVTYKQAMFTGFVAAIMLIVFFIALYYITRNQN